LTLQILTATRPSEARKAEWKEFDFVSNIWTIPPPRMKGKKEHRVPLSTAALALLRQLETVRHDPVFLFPAAFSNPRAVTGTLSAMTIDKKLVPWKCSAHGMRSSFRDWCGDASDFAREVCEACLAHVSGSATERSYRRGSTFEKRREVMESWADYLHSGAPE
jgi:integrase